MKTLKTNILLLFLLTLTNCPLGLPSIPAEHLYLWESTEDKDILFVLSHGEQTYNPATQSITQYIDQQEPLSMNSVFIYDEYNIKNKIKESGTRGIFGQEFGGILDKEFPNHIKINPLYDDTEIDKNKIEYYPISVIATSTGGKLAQRLYFRQDTPTHPIDTLSIDIDNNTIDFQHTFVSPPEYVFVPEKK